MILTLRGFDYFRHDTDDGNPGPLDLLFESTDMPPYWSMANYGVGKAIDPCRSSDGARIIFLSDLYPESLG